MRFLSFLIATSLLLPLGCGPTDSSKSGEDENGQPSMEITSEDFADAYIGRWFLEVTDDMGSLVQRVDSPDIDTDVTKDPLGRVILDDIGECGVTIEPSTTVIAEQGCVISHEMANESVRIEGQWSLDGAKLRVELDGTVTVEPHSGDALAPYSLTAVYEAEEIVIGPPLTCDSATGSLDFGENGVYEGRWDGCSDGSAYAVDCTRETPLEEPTALWSCNCRVDDASASEFSQEDPPLFDTDAKWVNAGCRWNLPPYQE